MGIARAPIAANRYRGFGFRSFGRRPGFGVTFRQRFVPRYYHHHFAYYPYCRAGYGFCGSYGYAGYGYPYAGYAYPGYYYGGYSYPWFSSDDSYDNSSELLQQNEQLQQQVNNLSNEVAEMRGEQEAWQSRAPYVAPPAQQAQSKPVPSEPTTLVFSNGRSEQVNNYAIAGRTLWIFNEQRARRVPLSELDVKATRKANEDRGVDFELPSQN
jgi:hypothetical protein